ncbi:unnamed protein product [Clonostachys rosea]|uniref:Uncharacterized protein n=1 Tax=Bionectria ochroleuca TaxID=29856 RepID=A0ABY6U6Q4_BIOOC|nr:unnamed protein product [Clonostachys rosea]
MAEERNVRMGETKFFTLKNEEKYTSTGFNSCLGVVIIGRLGGQWHLIMGHYACHEAAIADTMDMQVLEGESEKCKINNRGAAVNRIPELWRAHRHLFQDDLQAFLFRPERTDHEDMVCKLADIIRHTTGITPDRKYYSKKTALKGKARISVKAKSRHSVKIKFAE